MWIVANNAGNADIRIVGLGQRAVALDHRQPRRTRVTTTAAINAAGRTHVFHDLEMSRAAPFVIRRIMRTCVATAANLPRHVHARAKR